VGDIDMPCDPLRDWQERYASNGTLLGFKPEADAPFSSSIHLICDSPRVVRTTLSPGLLFRDRNMVRDGNDNRSLVVSLGSEVNFSHRGQDVGLGRHEATILHNDEPGKAGARRQFTLYEVSIPQQEWRMRSPHPGEAPMKVINRHSESLKLLLGYVGVLAKTGVPAVPEARDAVHGHVIDLAVLAATRPSVGESRAASIVAARRSAVLEHIAAHFQDPDLSGSSLAQSLGISQRYLQSLLQETGKSFTEHVNGLRLDRAFALLVMAEGGRRVSDIAFEVGFSDLAHFYRLFRARFGDTPKGILGSMKAPRLQ
jgi:AraC-like DNA-binding protein